MVRAIVSTLRAGTRVHPRVPTYYGSTDYGATDYGSTDHGSTYYYRYSWILECLVALVYGGGFIVMTPQAPTTYSPLTTCYLLLHAYSYYCTSHLLTTAS